MQILEAICLLVVGYAILMTFGFYQIKQGCVGIVKQFGVLKKELKEPGFHFRIPGYQQVLELNVILQTDVVTDIPCGTANGLLIKFDKIQVVNRLDKRLAYKTVLNYTQNYEKFWISDKIHHEINQFCSKHTLQQIYIDLFDRLDEELVNSLAKDLHIWAPGIEILSIRVTKPTIPKTILKNVQEMEKLKVQYLIANEREKVTIQEKRTNQTQRKIKAESNLQVKKINLQKKIDKKQNELKMAKIQSEIIFQREKTLVLTEFLAAFQEATIYPQLFTPEYLSFLTTQALSSNVNLTIGDSIPNIITSSTTLVGKPSKRSKKK